MTGQVKEDIIARWGELGVLVREGRIRFWPVLLRGKEFLKEPGEFRFRDLSGEERSLPLEKGSLAFTYCQVPIVYHRSKENKIEVLFRDGTGQELPGSELGRELSSKIFQRNGEIRQLRVWLDPGL
jgi:hypothetical protein